MPFSMARLHNIYFAAYCVHDKMHWLPANIFEASVVPVVSCQNSPEALAKAHLFPG